jgi:hypothetical protein
LEHAGVHRFQVGDEQVRRLVPEMLDLLDVAPHGIVLIRDGLHDGVAQ